MAIISFDSSCIAQEEKISMGPDNHEVKIDLASGQAALLLERLETLRSELGMVGEDLIALLRGVGAAPLAEPDSVCRIKAGHG
jgi:hypothetical protein